MRAKGDKGTLGCADSVGVHLLLIKRWRAKQKLTDNGRSVHVNNLPETSPPSEPVELKQQRQKKRKTLLTQSMHDVLQ